jgi:hypothetical protein
MSPTFLDSLRWWKNRLNRVGLAESRLPVCFPSVMHAHHPDLAGMVVNLVDNPEVPDPNAPLTFTAEQLAAPRRSWVLGQTADALYDSAEGRRVQTLQVTFGACGEEDGVHVKPLPGRP